MDQLQLIRPRDLPAQKPPKRPKRDLHKEALIGMPYFWRIAWPAYDFIILPCGHRREVYVQHLYDEDVDFRCWVCYDGTQ